MVRILDGRRVDLVGDLSVDDSDVIGHVLCVCRLRKKKVNKR